MANVAHATLTGADLHEPKGVTAATVNTDYVADGLGSKTWSSGSLLVGITGQISDFATPVAPTGWLECDGSAQSRSTFLTLFNALTIQQTGSRTNASAIITGLSSTTNMRAGYFVGGTGITNGTTILSVDSATQITMSANAGSTGSATVIVSAFAQGDGTTTFTLPDMTTSGRYRRSRTSAVRMGTVQTDATKLTEHTHTYSGSSVTGLENQSHQHGVNSVGATDAQFTGITATYTGQNISSYSAGGNGPAGNFSGGVLAVAISDPSHAHNVSVSGTTGFQSANHNHNFGWSGTTSGRSTVGDAETRPVSLVLMTCIKT